MIFQFGIVFIFGSYWQTDTNNDGSADTKDEKEPIKWRIFIKRRQRCVFDI